MQSNFRAAFFIGLFVLAIAPTMAHSQWSGALGSTWNNPTSASISRILIDRMNARMLTRRLESKRQQVNTPTPDPDSEVASERKPSAVIFQPSGVRITVPGIVRELGGTTEEQEQMTAMLVAILDAFDRESAARGLSNDVALAFASFIAFSASAFHDKPLPPDESVIALRDTLSEIAADTGAFDKADNNTRQQMYETLVIFGTLAYVGLNTAKEGGDSASASVYKQLAEQNIRTVLGLDPEKVTIGDDGLSFGQTAPANEAVPAPSNPVTGGGGPIGTSIPAGELVRQFEENEIRANQVFGGKRIRIGGAVNSIDTEPGGRASLTFRASVSSYGMAKCFFEKAQVAHLAQVRTNDQVEVEGTVKGLGGGWDDAKAYVVIEDCRVR